MLNAGHATQRDEDGAGLYSPGLQMNVAEARHSCPAAQASHVPPDARKVNGTAHTGQWAQDAGHVIVEELDVQTVVNESEVQLPQTFTVPVTLAPDEVNAQTRARVPRNGVL